MREIGGNEAWLVTGGAGFIGSNFVRLCLARTEYPVIVLDKLTYAGSLASLEDVLSHPRLTFVRGDIADVALVKKLFGEYSPSTLVNFAAETHVDRSIDAPAVFVETNVMGVFVLLEQARLHWKTLSESGRRNFRFLQVSTDEVYGSLGNRGLFTERTPVSPNSPYSASKASADFFAHAYFHTYGLPTLLTNCSNNYGPYQFPEKLIPLMILNAVEGKKLPIYGDGGNIRDWLFVEDHCHGILRVLEKGKIGERYNLGGCTERTNLELVDHICRVLEEVFPISENPALRDSGLADYRELKTFVQDRPGHDRRYAIDITKVKSELNWGPVYSLEEGLKKTITWYLENQKWCETVQSTVYHRERLGLC